MDIFKNILHMFRYKLRISRKLEDHGQPAGNGFCQLILIKIQSNASFLNPITYSDECVFHVGQKVNKNKVRTWEAEIPHEQREIAKNSEQVTAYSAMSLSQGIGPYYIYDPIVIAESYVNLLNNFIRPMLSNSRPDTIFTNMVPCLTTFQQRDS